MSLKQKLTPRQIEVLELMADGKKNEEIAESLCCSAKTVHSHIEHIFQRLDVHNRLDAVLVWLKEGEG